MIAPTIEYETTSREGRVEVNILIDVLQRCDIQVVSSRTCIEGIPGWVFPDMEDILRTTTLELDLKHAPKMDAHHIWKTLLSELKQRSLLEQPNDGLLESIVGLIYKIGNSHSRVV